MEGLLGRFLTFAFTTDAPREPATPVPHDDPLYAQMQARVDANVHQLSLAGRPLTEVLASRPELKVLWEETRSHPLFSMVTPLPDGRHTVLIQCDLRELIARAAPGR